WLSCSEIDIWVAAFERVWDPDFVFDSPEDELRVVIGLFVASAHKSSFHEKQSKTLNDYIDSLQDLIDANNDPTLTLTAGELIIDHLYIRGEHERGLLVESQIVQSVDITKSNPKRTAFFLAEAALIIHHSGVHLKQPTLVRKADQYRKQALLIAERFELLTVRILLAHVEANAAMQHGNLELAGQVLDRANLLLLPSMSWQLAWQTARQARLQLLLGRPSQALDFARKAIEFSLKAHQPGHYFAYFYNIAANCAAWLERYDEANEFNQTAIATATTAEKRIYLLASKMFHALHALKEDPDKANEQIRQFFLALHQQQPPIFGGLMLPQLARLCGEALKRDIELDIAKELIRRRKLAPPPEAPVNWPWPLRINALGEFSVTVADVPLTFEGKGQKKPLELLKLLVSFQGTTLEHVGPTVQRILDELWPDIDARDPQGSFEIALHRLRKLLSIENVIVMAEGRVSLNRQLAWWDVAAFETLAHSDLFSDSLAATKLYAGPLLRSTAFAWVAAPRERLAATYTRLIDRCAQQLESNKDYQGAIRLYEEALQQDNLIEPFYRGLMRSHLAIGESNEALRAYRRCRDLLSVVLGTKPTADTEAMKARIAAGMIHEGRR
ncbi:MAG: bacterial transcriptional activator domain-containing protein, partial [Betaproteobacteria bacterium]